MGHFVWIELMTTDPEGAKKFYASLVGWSATPVGSGGYEMWSMGEKQLGGLMRMPPELRQAGVPTHWLGYVGVDDVDQAVEKTRRLGGSVKMPGTDIPDMGRFAVLADPQGAVFAVFKGKGEGAALPREELGGLGWAELNTTDWKSGWKFYSELFGWQKSMSMDMGPELGEYFMFGPDADPSSMLGGMSNAATSMNMPPHWLYYVNVKSVDDAAQRIPELGGKVINGPMDVPGGNRILNGIDPQGGVFALVSGAMKH